MASPPNHGGESSNGKVVHVKKSRAPYTRYTKEQIELLEKIYINCSTPDKYQRAAFIRDEAILKGISDKHLRVWFQNRRCREKQKKAKGVELMEGHNRMNLAHKYWREQNDNMAKKIVELQIQMKHMRSQGYGVHSMKALGSFDYAGGTSSSKKSLGVGTNCSRIPKVVEEMRNEFLSKISGNLVNWTRVPIQEISKHLPKFTQACSIEIYGGFFGVAARACALIPFEPTKIINLLKDRRSWNKACRVQNVRAEYPTENGASIELIYTQLYGDTTLACARDFWTLRSTSCLADGSFIVCEKSVSEFNGVPSSPISMEFIRARMLTSGYLVRPCEGGSTVHIVEHMDFQASCVPEIMQPLYNSAEFLAKKTCFSALQYIGQVANEENFKSTNPHVMHPAIVRSLGQTITRSFNDAINGSKEDGWALITSDGSCDFYIYVKQEAKGVDRHYDSVICIKSSLVLENVYPDKLVRHLKERRSEWMHFNFLEHSTALSRFARFIFPGGNTHNLSPQPIILGNTGYEDEVVEVIRFDRLGNNTFKCSSEDIFHLQLTNGLEETKYACSEFIFAPTYRILPEGAALMASGFRVMSLGPNTVKGSSLGQPQSILTLAFQFPFDYYCEGDMIRMARLYVQHVISTIKNKFQESPSIGSTHASYNTRANAYVQLDITPDLGYATELATMMVQSYRLTLGVDMPGLTSQDTQSFYENLEHHQYAILCFANTPSYECIYANVSALQMFETTSENAKYLMMDRILVEPNSISLDALIPTLSNQGYATIPPGYFLTVMDGCVTYEKAVVWSVSTPEGSVHSIGLAFGSWSHI